jgi:hypothetical protein
LNGTNDTANRFSPQSDRTEHPWCNRRDFSTLAFNGRNRIDEILDKMLTLIKEEGDCIVAEDFHEQKILHDSLDILATEGGMFRKLKCSNQQLTAL